MTIRPALYADIPRLIELFKEGHQRSRFAAWPMDLPAAKQLLMNSIQCREQKGPGGSCLFVAERNGVIVGFIMGLLERCYHVGVPLMANDVYLYASKGRGLMACAEGLVDAYTAWASANPRVIKINLCFSDFIPGAARVARIYERKGYRRCGAIFELERNTAP